MDETRSLSNYKHYFEGVPCYDDTIKEPRILL